MKYDQSHGRHRLTNLTLASILLLTNISSALGYTEGVHLEFRGDVLTRVWMEPGVLLNNATRGYNVRNHNTVLLHDSKWGESLYECSVSNTPKFMSADDLEFMTPTNPTWIRYARLAEQSLDECTTWITIRDQADHEDLMHGSLLFTDGYSSKYGYTGVHINTFNVDPSLNSCSTSLLQNMAFGVITGGPQEPDKSAISQLLVECPKTSLLTIKVNNGNNLTTVDGSHITFKYDGSSMASAGTPLIINIIGTLVVGPSKPGSYSWSVPIMVSYE